MLVTWPDPVDLVSWAGRELGGLSLAVGVVGVVVFPVTAYLMLRPPGTPGERAVAATSVSFVRWMLVSVAVLDSSPFGLGWTHLRNLVAVVALISSW